MDYWKQFENRIYKESWARGIFVSQIPTGCRIVYRGGRKSIQLVTTDFDFAAGVSGRAMFFDAKADAGKNFNFKSHVSRPSKHHQMLKLLSAHDMGSAAGYLIWFYNLKQITWAPIRTVHLMIRDGAKSLNPDTPGVRSQEDWLALDIGKLAFKEVAK
jgi:hypothetical protein